MAPPSRAGQSPGVSRRKLSISVVPIVVGAVQPDAGDEITDAVLDATAELLTSYGLRRWTIDDVAELAGVGRTSVYRKFAGRDELVQAVLARELRQTLANVNLASADKPDPEDKVVEAALVALQALRSSLVERLLQSDPATFLPFLTTGAGPLLAIARQMLVTQALAANPTIDPQHTAELAEVAARLALSFILTRETVFPVDDQARAEQSIRRLIRPLLDSGLLLQAR
jgi:AcrR family transcriptional regulator